MHWLGALGAATVIAAPGPARATCSGLDDRPCLPTVCSVLDPEPCIPEIRYPLGQDLRLTVQSKPRDGATPGPAPEKVNTIQEMFKAIVACWVPPPLDQARPGMEITVRLSFNRQGAILGEPRFTFVTRDVSRDMRARYQRAVAEAISRCTPVPFTPEMGNAIAGRPVNIRFIDDRGIKRTERRP